MLRLYLFTKTAILGFRGYELDWLCYGGASNDILSEL
jgi:hypothetical protein